MLSRSRFLFLAQHAKRFGETVIAEMRGERCRWSFTFLWLAAKTLLGIDFIQADYLSGLGKRHLWPK